MNPNNANLYLIPSTIGTEDPETILPLATLEVIRSLQYFIVENEKTARAFLKTCKITIPQADLVIVELDKHDPRQDMNKMLKPARNGNPIGLLSEAGCPAVADPGSKVVANAHRLGIPVKPLVGPSSILLSLMASGLEGQRFIFHGYLPIDKTERVKSILKIEKDSMQWNVTQIFIEAPYRNNSMMKDLLANLNPDSRLCLAVDLHTETQDIRMMHVRDWKKQIPELHKRPTVFLLLY